MRLLLTIMFFCTAMACFAQEQVFYLKNNGKTVELKDSADYIRVIKQPDSGKVFYKVTEYYKSGKLKLTGESSHLGIPNFQGEKTTYSENGSKSSVGNYNDNKLVGFIHKFFPNGKPYLVIDPSKLPFSDDEIMANYDSLGKQLVTNGYGYANLYAEDFKTVNAEGKIKEGKRDGVWRFNDKNESRVETYSDQKFVEGVLTTATGETIKYTQREIPPEFKGGAKAFTKFLESNIQYPEFERGKNIQGKAVVSFVVERDGTLTEIVTLRTPSEGLGNEASRVIKLSPSWNPGIQYGRPMRVQYIVPVNFSLGPRP